MSIILLKEHTPVTLEFSANAESVHRVEFINWKDHTVCNVMINGVWRTCSFPPDTTVIEFLMDGSLANAHKWIQGRYYSHTK